jgi:hypothetical protein
LNLEIGNLKFGRLVYCPNIQFPISNFKTLARIFVLFQSYNQLKTVKMLNIVKESPKLLSKAADAIPNNVYVWSAVGFVVASTAVYMIKPLRRGLTSLLSPIFGRKKSRRIVRKVAQSAPVRRASSAQRSSSRSHRTSVASRRRMAHAH